MVILLRVAGSTLAKWYSFDPSPWRLRGPSPSMTPKVIDPLGLLEVERPVLDGYLQGRLAHNLDVLRAESLERAPDLIALEDAVVVGLDQHRVAVTCLDDKGPAARGGQGNFPHDAVR